jgi:hypothetical protein
LARTAITALIGPALGIAVLDLLRTEMALKRAGKSSFLARDPAKFSRAFSAAL